MSRRILLLAAALAACASPSKAAGAPDERDSSHPTTVGYGANSQPDPDSKLVPQQGYGAQAPTSTTQEQVPVFGLGSESPAAAQTGSAPQAAEPTYRSTRYVKPETAAPAGAEKPAAPGAQPAPAVPSSPSGVAATPGDVKESLPSLITAYVDVHGKGGWLSLKTSAKGPTRRLRFSSVDHGTEKSTGRGRWRASALFTDEAGRQVLARVDADFSGADWKVTRISAASAVRPVKTVKRRR